MAKREVKEKKDEWDDENKNHESHETRGNKNEGEDPLGERTRETKYRRDMQHETAAFPPVCHVDAVSIRFSDLALVGAGTCGLLNRAEQWEEDIGVIVGALVLQHRDQTLEAHAGVDVLAGEGFQAGIFLAVELDEDEVPDLQDLSRTSRTRNNTKQPKPNKTNHMKTEQQTKQRAFQGRQ